MDKYDGTCSEPIIVEPLEPDWDRPDVLPAWIDPPTPARIAA